MRDGEKGNDGWEIEKWKMFSPRCCRTFWWRTSLCFSELRRRRPFSIWENFGKWGTQTLRRSTRQSRSCVFEKQTSTTISDNRLSIWISFANCQQMDKASGSLKFLYMYEAPFQEAPHTAAQPFHCCRKRGERLRHGQLLDAGIPKVLEDTQRPVNVSSSNEFQEPH